MPAHTAEKQRSKGLQEGTTPIPREKACQILKDGQVNGKDLTPPQRRLFGAICNGQTLRSAEDGAIIGGHGADALSSAMAEVYLEDPGFLGGVA